MIGGGATGLGAGLEASLRGYQTLLLEQGDFAKGTSSRSTKLVHGGVRYLAQGRLGLVAEALRERGRLRRNAPHLVRDQAFVIPCYHWWCVPFYTVGLALYDLMAGRWGIGRSMPLNRKQTLEHLPCARSKGLRGGVRYYDCRFDDARLAVNLAQSILEEGGLALNYCQVIALLKTDGKVSGVEARDLESGEVFHLHALAVINATGVFVDRILKMDRPGSPDVVRPSQGIHLVLPRHFMNGKAALMIPKTSDGRVLFALPWHGHLVVGTTDVEKHEALLEPQAEEEEVNYILETAGRYLDCPPGRKDVQSVFTGLRPLAAPTGEGRATKEISRGHRIMKSESGLVTIIGGKWTTYRQMGEDVVRQALSGKLPYRKASPSKGKRLRGAASGLLRGPQACYGADLESMLASGGQQQVVLSEKLQLLEAQVRWAARGEMARTVEDVLARRTRALQLDARECLLLAPRVAAILAEELDRDQAWIEAQLTDFELVARKHIL